MSLILVAEHEGRYIERIRDALTSEGWRVKLVNGQAQALEAAAAEQPRLVLVNSDIDGAETLFRTFARQRGGPGVVALVPETAVAATPESLDVDGVVTKPFTDQELRMVVRRGLATVASIPAAPLPISEESQLTSADIFGDMLAEVETELTGGASSPPAAPRAAPRPGGGRTDKEIERRLEQTLSGLLGPEKKRPAAAPTPPRRRRGPEADVEALLSETLSGLDLPNRPRERPAPAPDPKPTSPPVTGTASPGAPKPPPRPTPVPPVETSLDLSSLMLQGVEERGHRDPDLAKETAPPPTNKDVEAPRKPPAATTPPRSVPELTPPGRPAEQVSQAGGALPTPVPDGQRFGQYTLLDRIAVGGMAEVWKARMTGVEGFQKTVAIKKILPHLTDNSDFVSMFIDEAKLAAQLSHPNIIHIYDLGKIGAHYYIAMEYVEGTNLRALLNECRKKEQRLTPGLALLITARLANALDYAHRKRDFDGRDLGLVHRDVSPQNVLISDEGDIKLCDFGIVKAVSKASQTQMGSLKGKLQYMSPEQAWGRPVDARSDIFSLGSLLFEMLTGERLFSGDSEISVLEAVRQCRVRAPRALMPELSEEIEAVVLKSLEQDPDRRFQSAGQMQQELDRILYSLRPTTNNADLAEFCQHLRAAPPPPPRPVVPAPTSVPTEAEPLEASTPSPAPQAAPSEKSSVEPAVPLLEVPAEEFPIAAAVAGEIEIEEGGHRGKGLLVAAIVLLVILGALGFWYFTRGPGRGRLLHPPATEEPTPPTLQAPQAPPAGGSNQPDEGTPTTGTEPPVSAAPVEKSPGAAAKTGATSAPAHPTPTGSPAIHRAAEPRPAEPGPGRATPTAEPESRPSRIERTTATAPVARTSSATAGPAAPVDHGAARSAPLEATAAPTPARSAPTPAPESRAREPATVPVSAVATQEPEPQPTPTPSLQSTVPAASPAPENRREAAAAATPIPSPTPTPTPSVSRPPTPPQVKLGQLVAAGPGVDPPVLVSFDKPQYPPMARRMRVQGDVILSLLVDENGSVQDVRLINGVKQNVGINEAAITAAHTAHFRPATKNGVRVKMWTTLRIPFRL